MRHLRRILLVAVIVLIDAFLLWVFYGAGPLHGAFLALAALPFFLGPIGGLWMVYDCIRYDNKPWPHVILAVIPFFFLWHLFERSARRSPARGTSAPCG